MAHIRVNGVDNIPNSASFFLPNRLDTSTRAALEQSLGGKNKVVYLVESELKPHEKILADIGDERFISFKFRTSRSRDLREQLMEHLREGHHIVFLPGRPSQPMGCLADVPKPFLMQLGALHISPVPIFTGFYRRNIWSACTTETEYDWAVVRIMPKLTPGPQTGERTLEAWLSASAEEYENHPILEKSLGRLLVEGFKKNTKSLLIDGMDGSELNFTKLLGVAIALAGELKRIVREPRLGIILPPGKGGMIANYACFLAGIAPVNINYTSSEPAFRSIIHQSGIRHFITARAFMSRLPQFPWPEEDSLLHLDVVLKGIGMARIATWIALARVTPTSLLVRMLGLDAHHGDDEAALIFTSGSSGEPKGVAYSHRMLIANICQLVSKVYIPSGKRFLCSLPLFHSFGLTVSTLLPPVYGYSMVTYPSPLDARSLNELIRKYSCVLVVTTPTFARAMLRRAQPDTFRSVRYFIVGAEKLPPDLSAEFASKCKVRLLEGYGLTETAPVCCVNVPDAPPSPSSPYYVPGDRSGTVGQVLPGLAVRITDPDDDDRALPLTEQGMIWLKGANVFRGYTGMPELNARLFRDGWFKTGDLGSVDLNAFLSLGGRRARFSKIGGEMVPHEAVETAIDACVQRPPDFPADQRAVCIVGVPDPQKGEALVLLSCVHSRNLVQALDSIRSHLVSVGLPRLWCPREIIPVESIPVLPTGKLDLRGCNILAREALEQSEPVNHCPSAMPAPPPHSRF